MRQNVQIRDQVHPDQIPLDIIENDIAREVVQDAQDAGGWIPVNGTHGEILRAAGQVDEVVRGVHAVNNKFFFANVPLSYK